MLPIVTAADFHLGRHHPAAPDTAPHKDVGRKNPNATKAATFIIYMSMSIMAKIDPEVVMGVMEIVVTDSDRVN